MEIGSIGIIGGTNGLGARLGVYFEQHFSELELLISGRSTKITNKNIVQKCDLVIFAVPIDVTETVINELISDSRSDQIWVDLTSIKQQPVIAMLKSKAEVCGLHPLFGPLPSIVGQPIIYCPARISEPALEALLGLFTTFDLIEMTPTAHDDTMGVVQCVSHLSDLVMGETLKESGLDFETIWRVSSPSYRTKLQVMGRMFAQAPDLYADIALMNQSGAKFDAKFQTAVDKFKKLVDKGDRDQLIQEFEAIGQYLTLEFCNEAYAASQQFMSSGKTGEEINHLEKTGEIAVFGERYSHTDQAMMDFFPKAEKAGIGYFSQIEEVFAAVAEGRFSVGIVPYENSNHGSVVDTLDALFKYDSVQITASQSQEINQHLLSLPETDLSQVQMVSSHPQALAQSRQWLESNLPNAKKIPARSTALAARDLMTTQDLSRAVIGGEVLARGMGLKIIARGIAPEGNRTRFIAIQKNKTVTSDSKYLSLVFWFEQDQAGNLASVLQFMADNQVNLIKLDSRRASEAHGQYLFFVDAEVSYENFLKLESGIADRVSGFRVLGAFEQ